MGLIQRTMTGRDPHEPHRASTPLELLFDLCFVVAVGQAAAQLHQGLGTDHVRHAVAGFVVVFFAIWWAWLNFTWFASAYDTDDVPYRLLTFVQIIGVLILASGVSAAFAGDLLVITVGYIVMRIALTLQWLRAAVCDEPGRRTALRYALALTVLQTGWIVRLFTPGSWGYATFAILAVAELAGPYWSEHTARMTTWHPQHIAERYGLFTIIVLGECVLSAFVAINAARTSASGISAHLAIIAGTGLLCMFSLWWIYFELSAERMLEERSQLSFVWGYGHYFLFASIAALGAGTALVASLSGDTTHGAQRSLSEMGQALSIAVPVGVALLLLALMRPMLRGRHAIVDSFGCAMAALVVAAGFAARSIGSGASLCLVAAIAVGRVVMVVLVDDRVDESPRATSDRSTSGGKLVPGRRAHD